jgi:hypothetical protein
MRNLYLEKIYQKALIISIYKNNLYTLMNKISGMQSFPGMQFDIRRDKSLRKFFKNKIWKKIQILSINSDENISTEFSAITLSML